MPREDVLETITRSVKILNRVATHRLITDSTYPELKELAEDAAKEYRQLIVTIGEVKVHWPDE